MDGPTKLQRKPLTSPRRGRPLKSEAEERQNRLLDYALLRFQEEGYRNVSVDDLASGFGVSKSTIYLRYGSKAGLMRAAMLRATPLATVPMSKIDIDPARCPVDVLRDFARVFSRYVNDPPIRALWQAVTEARGEIASWETIVAEETEKIILPVALYLKYLRVAGLADIDDEHQVASYFFDLTGSGFGRFLGPPLDKEQQSASNEAAIAFFGRGIGLKI